jgi:uncharacterized iron-regulated membrane protein
MRAREVCLKLHRWSGLYLATFLTVAGLTGVTMAYHDELEAALIPDVVRVEPRGSAMSPFELARTAEALEPRATVDVLPLSRGPREAALMPLTPRIDPATQLPYALDFNEVFLDPYSGKVLGTRLWGEVGFDAMHLMPMLYRMHNSLLLGDWGVRLFGIAALIWCINCFIGFYLTLPVQPRNFFRNWKRSWLVRSTKPVARFNFELHRAAALWVWAMLLVMSLSALQFNLNTEVFRPLLKAALPFKDPLSDMLSHPAPYQPQIDREMAQARGRALMAEHALRQGFNVDGETSLVLDRQAGIYIYNVRSSLDIRDKGGQTRVYFSSADGRDLGFEYPSIAAGNAVSSWLSALHMRRIGGAPYQAFIALIGLVVATLSITGVMTWLKRRAPARRAAAR